MIKLGTKPYKILQSGARGLRIILPDEWTGDRGLKPGDPVFAKQAENGIIITDKPEPEPGYTCYKIRTGNCLSIPTSWGYERGVKMYRYITGGPAGFGNLFLSPFDGLHEEKSVEDMR